MNLGYSEKMAKAALKKFAGDVDRAADWLFTQGIDGGIPDEAEIEDEVDDMIEHGRNPNSRAKRMKTDDRVSNDEGSEDAALQAALIASTLNTAGSRSSP